MNAGTEMFTIDHSALFSTFACQDIVGPELLNFLERTDTVFPNQELLKSRETCRAPHGFQYHGSVRMLPIGSGDDFIIMSMYGSVNADRSLPFSF